MPDFMVDHKPSEGYFLEVFEQEKDEKKDSDEKDTPWYVRLAHTNGNKLMTSEGYVRKGNAVRAAEKLSGALEVPFTIKGE